MVFKSDRRLPLFMYVRVHVYLFLQMQDYSKSASGEIEVKFQLTKDTLEAMLRSMTYISEQLSELVSRLFIICEQ